MSLRLATVSPTCLHSRLAQTCPYLRSPRIQILTLNSTRSLTSVAATKDARVTESKEFLHLRDTKADSVGRFEERRLVGRGQLNNPTADTTQPIRCDLPGEDNVNPFRRVLTGEPRNWSLAWERLHAELLEIRSDDTKKVEDVWHEYRDFAQTFIDQLDAEELKDKWHALPKDEKANILPELLAGSLVESAARTLFVLSSIDVPPTRSFRIRMQCLRHIHLAYPNELDPGSECRRLFEEEIARLRSPEVWKNCSIQIAHLDTLLTWSTPEQCEAIIHAFFEVYPFAQPESLLPIITSYVKQGDIDKAFELFKRLPEDILKDPSEQVRSICHYILKRDTVTKTEIGSNFKILPQILALGIQPDAALHNAVIEAAIANGVHEVAWDVYQYLKDNELEVNARSHLVLLRDAFQRGHIQAVNDMMTAIHENDDLVKDPYLIAYSMNIVRCICYFERKTSPREALGHILALYDRAYNRMPLIKLRMIGEPERLEANAVLPNPGPGSLAFTIWSYVLVQHSGKIVDSLWTWIKHLIANGDQEVIDAAKLDVIYNSLILFYARTPSSTIRGLQVIQDMLESNLCKPTTRTWSMLICGFLRHKQLAQAEMVLRMMTSRGVKIEDLREEYIPQGYSIKDMAAHVDLTLNERAMPSGLGDLMAESQSLASPDSMPQATHEEINSFFKGPRVWRGFADMRPQSVEDYAFNDVDT